MPRKITNREEFGQYCLRRLGHGMIQINLTPYQIDDRIDEAIQLWNERHFDGSVETVVKHQVTEEDIAKGYITLPDNVLRVEKVLPIRSQGLRDGFFGIEYQLRLRDIFDLRHAGSLSNFVMTKQYLGFLDDTLNGRNLVEFSRRKNRLEIHMDWDREVAVGMFIVMVVNIAIDPDNDDGEAYNDSWLKRYATALLKRQWGSNLSKFPDIEMLGGVTFNVSAIVSEADAEIEKLEQELEDRYTEPPGFFIG